MRKAIILILAAGFVLSFIGADDWGDFTEEEIDADSESLLNDSVVSGQNDEEVNDSSTVIMDSSGDEMGESKFTLEFYIAMGFLFIGIILIVFLAYAFFKRPKKQMGKRHPK
ncbi:MAG: hypothetical protein WC548_03340 [Candidatus Pacearchaeota archaeon]